MKIAPWGINFLAFPVFRKIIWFFCILWIWTLPYFICFTLLQSFLLIVCYIWLLGDPSNCFNFDHWELLPVTFQREPSGLQQHPYFLLWVGTPVSFLLHIGTHPFPQGAQVLFCETWYLEITVWALGVLDGLVIAWRPFPWTELEIYILLGKKIFHELILLFPIQIQFSLSISLILYLFTLSLA